MRKLYKKGICGILSVCLLAGALSYRNDRMQQDIADKILRFHVIANSDTKADQELKLEIRDSIGTYLQDKLKNVDNLEECINIVEKERDAVVLCAKAVIEKKGYDYPVKAEIADVDFPVKTYGTYTFPAGNYQALKVTIGSGAGENWWCVMYPNMCFSDSVYEVVEENAKEELKEVLTGDEYEEIRANCKIRVKFKYFGQKFNQNI